MISMDISHDGEYIIVSYRINENTAIVELMDREGHAYFRLLFEDELPFTAFSFNDNYFQIETKNRVFLYGI